MSDRVSEEVISCSVCSCLFHALCRDSKGSYDSSAISTKSFYDTFCLISGHAHPHQSCWGYFRFICYGCSAKFSKQAGKQNTAKTMDSDTQTIVSGNIGQNSLDASANTVDVDDSFVSTILLSLDDVKKQNEKLLQAVDRSETITRQVEDKIFDANKLLQIMKTDNTMG